MRSTPCARVRSTTRYFCPRYSSASTPAPNERFRKRGISASQGSGFGAAAGFAATAAGVAGAAGFAVATGLSAGAAGAFASVEAAVGDTVAAAFDVASASVPLVPGFLDSSGISAPFQRTDCHLTDELTERYTSPRCDFELTLLTARCDIRHFRLRQGKTPREFTRNAADSRVPPRPLYRKK